MSATLDLLDVYRSTYAIRRFEERAAELRHSGEITCSVHLCIGQEQVAVAARAALRRTDVVVATYRGHHWAIAWGVPIDALFAEFLGRADGINGGRAGAGLLMSPRHGFLGETGIVGAGPPIAVGAALAARYDGSERVALVAFGDGAMNQGAVHEAMNLAAVLDLGVIFLCENNGYAEYTPTEAMFRIDALADRAHAYGFSRRDRRRIRRSRAPRRTLRCRGPRAARQRPDARRRARSPPGGTPHARPRALPSERREGAVA